MNGNLKTNQLFAGLAAALLCGTCEAQLTQTGQTSASGTSDYAITQVGPHSRIWQNPAGQSVTEIATGMNFWNGQEWTPSDNSFAISPDGTSFVANHVQDPTRIAANINTVGAVAVTTPNGLTLSSGPVAIGLYDTASGLSVVLAAVTNSIGVLVDPQHVVFTNVFVGGGIAAGVVYSMPDTGSFHQDVVFTGFDPNFDPTVWGFPASSTNTIQIQIFTEFYGNVPQPDVIERDLYIETNSAVRASMASPDFIDYTLDFGNYVFSPGRAYVLSTNNDFGSGVTVAKSLVSSSGRTFLVESVYYKSLAGELGALPAPPVRTSSLKHLPGARKMKVAAASLPPLRVAKAEPVEKIKATKSALASLMPRGVKIDYVVTLSGVAPVVYASDTTYFVSGNVYDTGPVTMENCVFKFPKTLAAILVVEDTLTLSTTNYRAAIFTAADDNTCGTTLSTAIWTNYTGNPGTNRYGSAGLELDTSQNITLNNLRFCYMNTAIEVNADTHGQTLNVWDLQMVDCADGIVVSGINGSNTNNATLMLTLYNCLMDNVGIAISASGVVLTGIAYNCTADSSTDLFNIGSYTSGSFSFTNSIFSTLASKGTLGTVTLTGSSNGFYNSSSSTFGSYITGSNPYQTAGAGNYYLTNTSTFLTNGTTVIPATLLSQLEVKTTGAPLTLPSSLLYSTIVTPMVQRDIAGTAMGFHYDPIDFLSSCTVGAEMTLTLTNGVALAYYNYGGITLNGGAQLISQGSPNNRNYLIYYNLVQEQPIFIENFTNVAQSLPIVPGKFRVAPGILLRLTTICAPTGETNLLNTGDYSNAVQTVGSLTLRDCEVYGSGANWQMSESNNMPVVNLINNVFYRVPFAINNNATNTTFNNLFYGTTNTNGFTVSIRHLSGSSPNTNENNVFDGVTASLDGVVGYNAYLHGGTNTTIQSDDIVTNLTWQAGPFGNFYQPTNSPLLTNGSTNASNLGLFHYTVTTNIAAVEGSNRVSRGYHYIVVSTNGLPLDSNNDGVPDYMEDVNGNGTNDTGDETWNTNTSPWIGTQPVNQYAVQGNPATFSVSAYGTAPLSYQWMTNTTNISGATSSIYTISSAQSSDTATYTVSITNASNSVTSSGATLTVVIAPQLTNTFPPTNVQYWFQTNYDQLSTVVTNAYYGSATPLYYSQYLDPYLYYLDSYQWQFNGTNIPSASGTGSIVTYVTTFDGGTNTVVITNMAGTNNLTWTNIVLAAPGMVETWGSDGSGECNRPLSLTNATAIAAGEYQSIAVTDAGSVVQWGQYSYTNNGSTYYSVTNTSVASMPPTSGVVAVSAGVGQGLALLSSSGTVVAWGLSNDPSASLPNGLLHTNMIAVAAGYQFNIELNANGTVITWGTNTYHQTNQPGNLTNVTAIAAGAYHALAVSNGTVVAWGRNDSNQCNVPAQALSNVVAVAAGYAHSLALLSSGTVVAWGATNYGQTNVPAGLSNVMAIAAGDNHSVALLNNGTIVEWGANGSGQATVPQSNPTYPVIVKLLAAGGSHTMAAIFSSWVQYPVNVSKDLLLIYNANSLDSSNVCQYYRTHRPMVASANVLRIGCPTNETITPTNYTNMFVDTVQNWLATNPTVRPSYVILFPELPSRVNADGTNSYGAEGAGVAFPSVQYQLHYWCLPGWSPFVMAINMDGTNGAADCTNYINKLAFFGSNYSPGQLFISASAGGYSNSNWYFDYAGSSLPFFSYADGAAQGVTNVNPMANVIGTTGTNSSGIPNYTALATNVAGYFTGGFDGGLDDAYMFVDGTVRLFGQSGWYIMNTIDSYNGDRATTQADFLSWFATNSFGGTNYSNTPVGAVTTVDEPFTLGKVAPAVYYGDWAAGKSFAISAWDAQIQGNGSPGYFFQAIGDPFVRK